MEPHQLQIARQIHRAVGHRPPSGRAAVTNGEVVSLLNIIWAEERRADVAEESLQTHRTNPNDRELLALLSDA